MTTVGVWYPIHATVATALVARPAGSVLVGGEPLEPSGLVGGELVGGAGPAADLAVDAVEHAGDEVADVLGGRQVADRDDGTAAVADVEVDEGAVEARVAGLDGGRDLLEHVQLRLQILGCGTADRSARDSRLDARDRVGQERPVRRIPDLIRNALEVAERLGRGGEQGALLGGVGRRPPVRDLGRGGVGGDQVGERAGAVLLGDQLGVGVARQIVVRPVHNARPGGLLRRASTPERPPWSGSARAR